MFFVRPITHDDLPAVLALSERTGTGLTTLPATSSKTGNSAGSNCVPTSLRMMAIASSWVYARL